MTGAACKELRVTCLSLLGFLEGTPAEETDGVIGGACAPHRYSLFDHDLEEELVACLASARHSRVRKHSTVTVEPIVDERGSDTQLEGSDERPEQPWNGRKVTLESLRDIHVLI